MSKRDRLRQLIREFPSLGEVQSLLADLEKEDDRTIAIISVALIEAVLERIIIHRLNYKTPALIGQLFQNRGPLADFHSKILVATAFGIVGHGAAEELHRIKIVRNVFAHTAKKLTFDTPEIASELKQSLVLRAITLASEGLGRPIKPLDWDNKSIFILIVRLWLITYDGAHQKLGGNPLTDVFKD
jgi:DNA-binding MltR family transcriptional regulator